MIRKREKQNGHLPCDVWEGIKNLSLRFPDGCYLGHYAQWFFWFFFTIGFSVVAGGIAILIAQRYGA